MEVCRNQICKYLIYNNIQINEPPTPSQNNRSADYIFIIH